LGNGGNTVTVDSSTMDALNVQTGMGSDLVTVEGCTIRAAITVALGGAADTLILQKGSNGNANLLPDPLLGTVWLDGGLGVDTLKHDAIDPVPGNTFGFQSILLI
jgi:hypothetical protein